MTGVATYPDFESAYLDQLQRVYAAPQFVNAPRGNQSREILSVAFRIDNPRERIVRRSARKYNLVFNFAEVLWYLSGAADLAFMAFYAPLMTRYSADGQRLQGTAYGPRIFHHGAAGINQWENVIRVLEQDPDSKRAFIQIFAPEELLVAENVDVACTIGLQFFVRDRALHTAAFMRANDAFRGCVSDVFAFTFLHELMANELGVALGSYTHFVSTYHIYDADLPRVTALLDDPTSLERGEPFPALPMGDNWASIREVLAIEHGLRLGYRSLSSTQIERLALPSYWRHVVSLLAIHADYRHEKKFDRDKLALLPRCFRTSVENLWWAEMRA